MSQFKSFFVTAFVAAMAAFILVMPAKAASIDFANPAFARVAGQTSIPVGHAEFCKSHRAECGPNRNAIDATELSKRLWADLVQVNNAVNAAVTPVSDQDYYHVAEYWAYPDGYGDCEDIALAKRRALIENGWNPSTLLMAVVREGNGNGHAVLMVRTDRGDLILDNQDGRILLWNETPYQYLKRQSQAHAGQWVDFVDTHLQIVASK